jgi:HAE1 family hydrophobic/amphiphilic exporter-1
MLPNRSDIMWNSALVPETPVDLNAPIPALDDAIKYALATRPELVETALAQDINALNTRLAREGTRPRIDAFANLTAAGLAGTVGAARRPARSTFPGSEHSGAVQRRLWPVAEQPRAWQLPTAQVGVQMSFPIRNRTAQAQASIAAAEGRRLQNVENQVGMAVEADVRSALQNLTSTRARLEAAGLARQSAEEQDASEQRQFQAGTSSVFLVLQRQTDLITARNREVRARADFGESPRQSGSGHSTHHRSQSITIQ